MAGYGCSGPFWIRFGYGAAAAAACLILVVCFGEDHLLLYFWLVAWGLLDWIK
jgi:hypothetical protein